VETKAYSQVTSHKSLCGDILKFQDSSGSKIFHFLQLSQKFLTLTTARLDFRPGGTSYVILNNLLLFSASLIFIMAFLCPSYLLPSLAFDRLTSQSFRNFLSAEKQKKFSIKIEKCGLRQGGI
jgi:hypothetical protein